MTLDFHLAHLGRKVRIVGGVIEYLDGLPSPTAEELEATRAAAEAAWAAKLLADELPARRDQMAAILDALPVEVQAMWWPTRIAVEAAFERGRLDLARAQVVAAEVPPELEATKTQILALFPVVES